METKKVNAQISAYSIAISLSFSVILVLCFATSVKREQIQTTIISSSTKLRLRKQNKLFENMKSNELIFRGGERTAKIKRVRKEKPLPYPSHSTSIHAYIQRTALEKLRSKLEKRRVGERAE